jgi:hypothetical protein
MNEEKVLEMLGTIILIPVTIMFTPTILFIKLVNRLYRKKV